MADLTPLQSSMLTGYRYDAAARRLTIRTTNGQDYHYADVPQDVADGLGSAPSAGGYFATAIRGKFDHIDAKPALFLRKAKAAASSWGNRMREVYGAKR